MSKAAQQQDHPGPEWVGIIDDLECGVFIHPGAGWRVLWAVGALKSDDPRTVFGDTRDEAVTHCRQISAAALAWERMAQEARNKA